MELDIQYLLFLQNLRNALGGSLDEIFNSISKIAVDVMPLLPFMVFWCVNKKWGYRFLSTYWCGEIVNGIIKLTVCAYRPWIRSDRIEPAGDSKVAATGYSFPSGHSTVATSVYGTVIAWQHKKRQWLSILCGVMLALTLFSRNFLGVHTPQDVVVGFGSATIIIIIVGKVYDKLDGNDKLCDILSLIGLIFVVLVIIYISVKPYPMDYVDGKLLVDPKAMMNDTFKGCGGFTGFIIGAYIERHYIHYKIPTRSQMLAPLTAVGLGIYFSWHEYVSAATVVLMFGKHWGNFLRGTIEVIFGLVIFPYFIMKMTEQEKIAEKTA